MSSIDWFYLKRPIIMLMASILVFVLLILGGYQYEKIQSEEYQKAEARLRSTHKIYNNMVNDIDLLEKYRTLYSAFKASGLVGKERRLSWVESLESTNGVLRLPTLTYDLNPQEKFLRPGFKAKRGVEVNSSPMDLSMGLLHEEDLFALLEGLRLSIKNLFTVDSCSIYRSSSVNSSLDTKRSNLTTKCTIRWVTIDAK